MNIITGLLYTGVWRTTLCVTWVLVHNHLRFPFRRRAQVRLGTLMSFVGSRDEKNFPVLKIYLPYNVVLTKLWIQWEQ